MIRGDEFLDIEEAWSQGRSISEIARETATTESGIRFHATPGTPKFSIKVRAVQPPPGVDVAKERSHEVRLAEVRPL